LRGQEKFAGEGAFGGTVSESLFGGDPDYIGIIVFERDVREDEVTGASVETFRIGEIFTDGMIGKMAGAGKDALLDYPGIGTHLEHFEIVIGFKHQAIRIAEMYFDQFGHVAEIGDDGHLDATSAKREANRICGIVRNGKGMHVNIANGEMLPGMYGFDAPQTLFEAIGKNLLQRIKGWLGHVERGFVKSEHLGKAVAVIGMLVGDENPVELIESDIAGSEACERFAFAESAIDEEASALRFKQRDVARTAGSQNGNAQADRSFSEKFVAAKPVHQPPGKFLG